MQILKVDQHTWVNRLIRDEIQAFDELKKKHLMPSDVPGDIEDLDDFKKFSIGSKQPPCTIDQISRMNVNNHAFSSFRTRLNTFLSASLGCAVDLKGNAMVSYLLPLTGPC